MQLKTVMIFIPSESKWLIYEIKHIWLIYLVKQPSTGRVTDSQQRSPKSKTGTSTISVHDKDVLRFDGNYIIKEDIFGRKN